MEQETEENFGSAITCDSTFSPDDKMIFFLSANEVMIFEKGNDKYELFQEIEDSSATLRRVSISQKASFFAVSEVSLGRLLINYVLQETLEVSSSIWMVKIIEEVELVMTYGSILSWWKDHGHGFIEEGNLNIG